MLTLPVLHTLPSTLPLEGAIAIELQEGIPIFRASQTVQQRIEALLEQQQTIGLAEAEALELDAYEEMDDYISFVNRTIRNLAQQPSQNLG
ncbi:MAG: hypothetical protein AAGD25_38880 [Cyanobacteria bacterium P01_F01_bin.150]